MAWNNLRLLVCPTCPAAQGGHLQDEPGTRLSRQSLRVDGSATKLTGNSLRARYWILRIRSERKQSTYFRAICLVPNPVLSRESRSVYFCGWQIQRTGSLREGIYRISGNRFRLR